MLLNGQKLSDKKGAGDKAGMVDLYLSILLIKGPSRL